MTSPGRYASAELLEFLKDKRWFGDKAREPRRATVRDAVPIDWPSADAGFAVLRVDVESAAGRSTYQLFVERDRRELVDALQHPGFQRGLVDAFSTSARFSAGGIRWSVQVEGTRALVIPPGSRISLSQAEQSNSSLVVDGVAILKIFRKIEPGLQPDVEVTRFLTIERRFLNVPVLLGTIAFEDADGVTIAGMLQELVPGARDAWSHALDVSRDYFAGREGAGAPPFEADARALGAVTRALHESLASGDAGSAFQSRAVRDEDLNAWSAQTSAMLDRATASLRQALATRAIPGAHAALADEALRMAGGIRARVPAIVRALGDDRGRLTRTHGDYHLGQVLRSASGQFFVIDFEGEPARPLSERRAHHSPLRDVAGMLRSFAYASAVGRGTATGADARTRADAWESRCRAAFLEGYFTGGDGARGLLPSDVRHADQLMSLFEIEKLFYELQYELDHRPDWVWVPLSGVAKVAS